MSAVGATVSTIVGARITGPGSELLPVEGAYDVFIEGGRVTDLAPTGAVRPVGEVLQAGGAWLIPGLWDHHVHTVSAALTRQREPLGGAESAHHAAHIMSSARLLGRGIRVGAGFRDAFWPDEPTLEMLDAATGTIPTYLINADLHSVWLNSAAFAREQITPPDASGMLREEPAFEITRRLAAASPDDADAAVADLARHAAARGVVGIIDLDMAWNADSWSRRVAAGFDSLRVEFGTYPSQLSRLIETGRQSGERLSELITVGPLKVITDGSLGTRTAACSHPYPGDPHNHGVLTIPPADLVALMTDATAHGISCAIHAIGDLANTHALDAFAATGATGTIEHAQLVAAVDIPRFARLGVGASVQPEHALDDRDLSDTIWSAQIARPYPFRELVDAGANLLFGSDAPVAPLDPWAAMASAIYRTRDGRPPWQVEQAIDARVALAASTHGGSAAPGRIEPGTVADLVLCAQDPLTASESDLRTMPVRATLLGGRVTHLED